MARGSVKLSIYSTFKDDGTKKAQRALDQFAKKYGQVDKATGKLQLDPMTQKLAEQSVKWDRLSQRCNKFAGNLDKAAKKFAPFSAAAAGALGGSIKLAADFESAMGKVATIMDKSQMSVKDMGDKLLALSNDTGKSVTELAEAAYQAQSASVETADTVDFVATAVGLSKAGFTETATAVDTLTTIINAYGLEASDAASLADKLVQTQNKGKTTVDELSASIGQAIPTAAAYGVNIDNLLSSYVVLTKQGINTANATTYLNGMMNELSKEGTKVSDSLQELTGKGFNELMADGYSVADVLQIIYDSVDGDSTAFANLWGNVRAGKGALAIVNGGTAEFNAELQGMGASAGVVESALEDLDTPAVKAQKALNSLKNTGILLGQEVLAQVAPALEKLVQSARDLFERFQKMPAGQKRVIVAMLEVTAAIAPLLKLMASGARMMGSFSDSMGKLTARLAKMSAKGGAAGKVAGKLGTLMKGPVVIGIMAAAAAIAVIVKLFMDWKKKQENLKKATKGLVEATGGISSSADKAREAVEEWGGAAKLSAKSVDELMESQAALADQIQQRNGEAETSISRLQAARDVIDQYANKTDLTTQQQGQLRSAIALVNDQCGTQYTVVDAVNGVIQDEEGNILDTVDAIDQYIEKKQEQIQIDALAADLEDLYQQKRDDIAALAAATDEYNIQAEKASKIVGPGAQAAQDNLEGYRQKMLDAQAALESTDTAIANTTAQMGAMEGAAMDAEQSVGDLARTKVEITASLPDEDLEGFIEELEESGISTEDFQKLSSDQLMKLAANYRNRIGSVSKTLDGFKNSTKVKGTLASKNFASGILGAAGQAVSAAATMSSRSKGAINTNTYSLGSDFANGFKRGIINGTAGVVSAAASMAQRAMDKVKKTQNSGSPSKKMAEQGKWFGQGYEIGISREIPNVERTAGTMADAALGQFGRRPEGAVGRGGTNIYIDGARVNDNPAIQAVLLSFLMDMRRLSYV